MANNVKDIINSYYEELQKGFKTGKLNFDKLNLAPNVSIIGPNESFSGEETIKTMFQQFISMVNRFEIKRQFFDQDSSCTVLDCVTKSPVGAIPTVEWILVKNGRIVEIRVYYDTVQWAKVLQNVG
jgi:hypothetical protein